MISLFPLTFLSNAFVPITALPQWLQYFAAFNPISALVQATRELFGNPTGAPTDYWTLNNAALYTVISCVVIIAIFAPLAVRKYRTAARK